MEHDGGDDLRHPRQDDDALCEEEPHCRGRQHADAHAHVRGTFAKFPLAPVRGMGYNGRHFRKKGLGR